MNDHLVRKQFSIDVGFTVSAEQVINAVSLANTILADLPSTLYKSLDYKTTSAMVGSIFCDSLAGLTDGIVNPIEKGHPDIVPASASSATEEQLRNYPEGLEIKCTVGGIEKGANLRAGVERIDQLTGVTWQAHHREVKELMGLVWDFCQETDTFRFPGITGVFYSPALCADDWGKISGTTGRNTKVTGMTASGKQKMGKGWIVLLNDKRYLTGYGKALGFTV